MVWDRSHRPQLERFVSPGAGDCGTIGGRYACLTSRLHLTHLPTAPALDLTAKPRLRCLFTSSLDALRIVCLALRHVSSELGPSEDGPPDKGVRNGCS